MNNLLTLTVSVNTFANANWTWMKYKNKDQHLCSIILLKHRKYAHNILANTNELRTFSKINIIKWYLKVFYTDVRHIKYLKFKKWKSYYEVAFIQLEMINAWSAIVIYTIEKPLRDRRSERTIHSGESIIFYSHSLCNVLIYGIVCLADINQIWQILWIVIQYSSSFAMFLFKSQKAHTLENVSIHSELSVSLKKIFSSNYCNN
jgi:hypothetical protein